MAEKQSTKRGEPLQYMNTVVFPYSGPDCLIWPYATTSAGYGHLWFEGKHRLVSRLACAHRNGEPPSSKHEAAHSCGNGHFGCCNPTHLDWKTPKQNSEDKRQHGTIGKLKPEDVQIIRRTEMLNHELAKIFHVTPLCIKHIRTGETWAWLK